MPQPPQDVDTLFEDLLQDLPPETVAMARAFKAFTRARKLKTPVQLLRLVLLYCGLDKSLREVAGSYTLLVEAITDSSVAERLAACRPWVRALLAQMVPSPTTLPAQRRFLVLDASGLQAPGARGTQYRLHLCMELVTLSFVAITVTDKRTGESLRHFPLGPGDVAVADRGYGHPATLVQTVQQGADVLVRLNAHNVPVTQPGGSPLDWAAALGQQAPTTVCTLPVQLAVAGAAPLPLWVHAYRLPEAQAAKARRRCRQHSRKGGHQPTQQSLLLAGWVLVVTSLPPTLLPGPTALALYRVRWQIEVCQTQPVKMTWCPLRRAPWAISGLRGILKREHVVDIHLFCRHDHFADQAVRDGLALFKRKPVQIVPQQSPKGFGMVDDLLPMPRLVLRAS